MNQLIQAAQLLDIPILVTEHYKKGLGETVPEVKNAVGQAAFFQKEYFSACLEDDFLETVRKLGRPKIVIVGMETHVCVLQTGMDLIQAGYQLHVVKNALASRYEEDWKTAVKLFRLPPACVQSFFAMPVPSLQRLKLSSFNGRVVPTPMSSGRYYPL